MSVSNSSMYAYTISVSYLLLALVLPMLSGIADYSGRRLSFLKFFTILGSTACMLLFFFQGMEQVWIALIGFMLAMIGFDGGKVFYNSYLPIIATEDQYDRVSAKGFSYGYIGSVLLLIVNLVMIMNPAWFGIENDTLAVRLSFVMVGLWWIGFAQIPFHRLPADTPNRMGQKIFRKGFQEIQTVWHALKPQVNTRRFLISFFCYSAGVQTILYLAATFAEKELSFGTSELIILILILQIVAIAGAYLFALVSQRLGNKIALCIMLVIWIGVCILAYLVQLKMHFYLVAGLVGLVMGGIQSLSRSTYAKLIDDHEGEVTSYFSFYEVLEKLAIVFGTFSFGLIDQITGTMRDSIAVLTLYFIIGMLILLKVRIQSTTP